VWKNKRNIKRRGEGGTISISLTVTRYGTWGHNEVELRPACRARSQHISTHDLYDSFTGLFYQNEVANKLDKIRNGRVCSSENWMPFVKLKLVHRNTKLKSQHFSLSGLHSYLYTRPLRVSFNYTILLASFTCMHVYICMHIYIYKFRILESDWRGIWHTYTGNAKKKILSSESPKGTWNTY
jgi:hypothetical protein